MTLKRVLIFFIFLLFIVLLIYNLGFYTDQQFVVLAKDMLRGSFFPQRIINVNDYSYFNGRYFWPLGPFPAIMLMPFVSIFPNFSQNIISFPLSVINFFLLYKIARILNLDEKRSLIIPTFFIFGSVYFPLAAMPASWYFAQVVACTFIIAAIYEFLTRKRYILIGLFISFAVATRFSLLATSVFFIYFIFKRPFRVQKLLQFSIPIVITVILLGFYNWARFGNPTEAGYGFQITSKAEMARRQIGLFSPKHIFTNAYYLLLKGPEPIINSKTEEIVRPYFTFNAYGLSIFFLSPVLFLLFLANYKDELAKISISTSILTLIPILLYYGIGKRQVGYRYALDFLPFLYLIICQRSKKVPLGVLGSLVIWGIFFSIAFTELYLQNIFVD